MGGGADRRGCRACHRSRAGSVWPKPARRPGADPRGQLALAARGRSLDPRAAAMNRIDRPTTTSAGEAEREAARTRIELATTIDALDDKLTNLTTRNLVEKGFNMIRDTLNNSDAMNRG